MVKAGEWLGTSPLLFPTLSRFHSLTHPPTHPPTLHTSFFSLSFIHPPTHPPTVDVYQSDASKKLGGFLSTAAASVKGGGEGGKKEGRREKGWEEGGWEDGGIEVPGTLGEMGGL